MARLPHYGKLRKKGFKKRAKYCSNILNASNNFLNCQNSTEKLYLKDWFKWILYWLLHLPQVFILLLSKLPFRSSPVDQKRNAKYDDDDRVISLESKLSDCMTKIQILEEKISALTKVCGDRCDKNHQNVLPRLSTQQPPNMNEVDLTCSSHQEETSKNVPEACIPAPPPPPPPPPPHALLPLSNIGNIKRVPSQLKLSNNTNKPRPNPMTPRPLISVEDLTRVKLKKTPCIQRNEKNDGSLRVSLEALRSVKLRKTNYEHFRTSPRNPKSPTCKVNSRLNLRRASIDASPRTTPSKNRLSSNLFGEDLTPIITCALKKRFDALNFSFEEGKENQEPFSS